MALEKNQAHRPGAFKQSNKEHKHGRHRSKGSISVATKGKVSLKAVSKRNRRELNRDQRRHQSSQLRQKKRDEVLAKKRSLGGLDFAPFFVSVIPLNKEFDPTTALSILSQCDEDAIIGKSTTGVTHICIPRFKKRFSLVVPHQDNELDVLDTLKVADTVLFLLSAINGADDIEGIIDRWGNKILMSCLAQGLPTPVVALTDLESIAPKKRNEFKQDVQKMVTQWLPEEKLMVLDKNVDGINILRKIGDQKRKSVFYRDRRAYLYGEELEYIPDNEGKSLISKIVEVDALTELPNRTFPPVVGLIALRDHFDWSFHELIRVNRSGIGESIVVLYLTLGFLYDISFQCIDIGTQDLALPYDIQNKCYFFRKEKRI